jgi:hypothetical protein
MATVAELATEVTNLKLQAIALFDVVEAQNDTMQTNIDASFAAALAVNQIPMVSVATDLINTQALVIALVT